MNRSNSVCYSIIFYTLEFTMNAQSIKNAAATTAKVVVTTAFSVATIAAGVAAGGLLLAKLAKKD